MKTRALRISRAHQSQYKMQMSRIDNDVHKHQVYLLRHRESTTKTDPGGNKYKIGFC